MKWLDKPITRGDVVLAACAYNFVRLVWFVLVYLYLGIVGT